MLAALWNWGLGATFTVRPRLSMDWSYLAGSSTSHPTLWSDCFTGLGLVFGAGFFLVSLNMHTSHGLVRIAIMEKTWAFIVSRSNFLMGRASIAVPAVVTGDLIFGLLL